MNKIKCGFGRILSAISQTMPYAFEAARVMLLVLLFDCTVAVLWIAVCKEWLDESIIGQATFMAATSAAFAVSAEFSTAEQPRRYLRILGRGAGLSALLLTAAALTNLVLPGTFALSWPVPQDWRVHITPVTWMLAAIAMPIIARSRKS